MAVERGARQVFLPTDAGVNAYGLLTSLVVPRPIAWVSTLSADGVGNLAPHSFFTVASAQPPVVQFTSVGTKDTLRNVLATGEFVVNIASLPMLAAINASSASYGSEVDEAEIVGVIMEASERVSPQRVAESPASIECRLHSTVEVGDSTLVLGEVVAVTVRDELLHDGHPMIEGLAPLSRLGGDQWGLPPQVISVERPR